MNMKLVLVLCASLVLCSARHLTEADTRIVNGDTATRGQIPWQVFLDGNGQYSCGGSLISNEWVLTAGHCADSTEYINIQLGATRRNETEPGRIWISVSHIILHPTYSRSPIKNDIALLRLSQPVEFTEYIRPITLAPSNYPTPDGSRVYASGWGILGKGLPTPPDLHYAELITTTTKYWAGCNGGPTERKICILGENDKSASAGDSGGPLYQINSDGIPIHIGIASTAVSQYKTPNTFTRTAMYIDFINQHTGLHLP